MLNLTIVRVSLTIKKFGLKFRGKPDPSLRAKMCFKEDWLILEQSKSFIFVFKAAQGLNAGIIGHSHLVNQQ